jgi:hypothetical protein
MHITEISKDLRESILSRDRCICFVVYDEYSEWVIDFVDNFTLDQQKNIDALCNEERYRKFLPKGLSIEQWGKKLRDEFRGGIVTLTKEAFLRYRNHETAKITTTEMLHREFFLEDIGQYSELSESMQKEISFNAPMREDLVQLRVQLFSKLPKFYINYDRKIFMHMVRGRFYESAVLDGWWAAEGDFEHMIPTSHRYWVRNIREDFWSITNFRNMEG